MLKDTLRNRGRRDFIVATSALAGATLMDGFASAAEPPAMRGLYPIAWTPCTPDNKLDLKSMAAQVKFCQRGNVAGLVWPQIVSGWFTLSEQEWSAGSDALLSTAKGGKTKIIIGVQTVGGDTQKSLRYAKSAAARGAHAIISLPPENASDDKVIDYYKALGDATSLPLMVQAVGNFSVDLIVKIVQQVPAVKAVKDEAGDPLVRAPQLFARTNGKLLDFSGGNETMLSEMELGFAGKCTYFGLSDVLQQSFDLWQEGRRKESFEMYGRTCAFDSIPGSKEYVMIARGVFPENAIVRIGSPIHYNPPRDEAQKKFIREALDSYLKPYLRA